MEPQQKEESVKGQNSKNQMLGLKLGAHMLTLSTINLESLRTSEGCISLIQLWPHPTLLFSVQFRIMHSSKKAKSRFLHKAPITCCPHPSPTRSVR